MIRSSSVSSLSTNLSPVSELAIDLDRNGGDALHRQIEASIRQRIRSGALPAGVALPPTRALAAELGVTRGVVVEAYAQLVAEGYLTSRSGGYTQVAPASAAAAPAAAAPRPGRPAPVAPASPGGRLRLRPRQPRGLPAGRLAALGPPRPHRGRRRASRLPRRPRGGGASVGARRLPQPRAGDQRRSRDDRHHQRLRASGVAADRSAGRPRRQNGGRRGPVGL